jgi:hypothetical protein
LLAKDFSTSALQDSQRVDLAVLIAKLLVTNTKLDSINVSLIRIEGYVDNLEPKLDSLEVTENLIQTNTANSKTLLDSVRVDFTRNHNDLLNLKASVDTTNDIEKNNRTHLAALVGKDFSTQEGLDSALAVHKNNRSHLAGILNQLSNDSLSVKDIINLKNLLTQILSKQEYPDSSTVKDIINIKNLLTQINNKLDSDSLSVKDVLGIKQNQTNGTQKAKPTDASGNLFATSTNPFIVSNVPGFRDTTITVTIDSLASLSSAINLGNRRVKGIQMPASGWVTANLTFQVSYNGGSTYQNYYVDDVEHTMASAVATNLNANPRTWVGVSYLKIRSGTSGTPVVQNGAAATRTIKLRIGNY